jgi:hypothetical protein
VVLATIQPPFGSHVPPYGSVYHIREHQSRDVGVLPPGEPDSSGLGWPPPVSVPLGEGEAEPDSGPEADGDPDWLPDGEPEGLPDWDPDWLGDPDWGEGEPDWGGGEPDCDCGGGLPEPPVGVGGVCGGWLRKIRIAIRTAIAASRSINSQETRIVFQPARS